jgi:hypothetical protein
VTDGAFGGGTEMLEGACCRTAELEVVKNEGMGGAGGGEVIGTLEGVSYRVVDVVVVNDGGIGGAGGILDVFLESSPAPRDKPIQTNFIDAESQYYLNLMQKIELNFKYHD